MSLNTSAQIIDKARWFLNDRAASDNLASYDRMKHTAHAQATTILSQVGYEMATMTLASVVGQGDYVLTAGANNPAIFAISITDTRWIMERVSFEMMQGFRWLSVSAGGDPKAYSVYEDSSGQLVVRFWPVPNRVGQTFDVWFANQVPDANSDGDGFTLQMTDSLALVVARATAMEILTTVDNDILKTRGLSKDVLPLWNEMVQRGIKDERIRINRQSRTGKVELFRS